MTSEIEGIPNDDVLFEAAYLVARGVRCIAYVGTCTPTTEIMDRTWSKLANASSKYGASPRVIPFVFPEDHEPARAVCGYAAKQWCVDLLQWTYSIKQDRHHAHEIMGLLLGYSAEAIAEHHERVSGKKYERPF